MAKRGPYRRLPGEPPDIPDEMKRPYGFGVPVFRLRDIDVATVRKRLGLSQARFAQRFGFPVSTLRHWEQGIRKPRGCALAFIHVIARYPANATRAILGARVKPDADPKPQPRPATLAEIERALELISRRRGAA